MSLALCHSAVVEATGDFASFGETMEAAATETKKFVSLVSNTSIRMCHSLLEDPFARFLVSQKLSVI